MNTFPVTLRSELVVNRVKGCEITEHDGHLVVRSAANPLWHWGNCLVITEDTPTPDPAHYRSLHEAAFPAATFVSIHFSQPPGNENDWLAAGFTIDHGQSFTSGSAPERTEAPTGYVSRQFLTAEDFAASFHNSLAHNEETGEFDAAEYREFRAEAAIADSEAANRGDAAWFGAWQGEELAADLGIVVVDGLARYQRVLTAASHRRRGLCRHLLAEAGAWAAEAGATEFVIATDEKNPAARVYAAAGFSPAPMSVSAFRYRADSPKAVTEAE